MKIPTQVQAFFTKKTLQCSILYLVFFLTLSPAIHSQNLQEFIHQQTIEVNEQFILENIRFYLNHRIKDNAPLWYSGSVVNKQREEFSGLHLKFNTIDNSVNVAYGGRFYRIKNGAVVKFTLNDEGTLREFERGFSESRIHEVTGNFDMDSADAIQFLMKYRPLAKMQILDFNVSKNQGEVGSLHLRVQSPNSEATFRLKHYLTENQHFTNIQASIKEYGMDERVFFEVLVEGKQGKLLKLHSKRSSQSESVSLVKDSKTMTFDKFEYYLANSDGIIRRVILNKKSIKKALAFSNIETQNTIPILTNEKKLIAFFQLIL